MLTTNELIKFIEFGFKSNQFILKSQPIVSLKQSLKYHDYEIFITTKNDFLVGEDGLSAKLPLGLIIEALEENEKSMIMDAFVIKNVIKLINTMPESLIKPSMFHVNLSGNSLNNELFMTRVLSWIERQKNKKNKLSFELTETARIRIDSLKSVADFMLKVQSFGCEFSLGDFGKGHSPFKYLIKLPINKIKIDGCYIQKMLDSKKSMGIVKSLVYLAKELNIKTVAECIENKAQYKIIKSLGVDYGQGWYFSKPSYLEGRHLAIPNKQYPLSDITTL